MVGVGWDGGFVRFDSYQFGPEKNKYCNNLMKLFNRIEIGNKKMETSALHKETSKIINSYNLSLIFHI